MMMMTPTTSMAMSIKHTPQQQQHQQNSQVKKQTSTSGISARQVFMNKRFYLHLKCKINYCRADKVIKAFGGQVEEFLEPTSVSYLLTDIPPEEWPPNGNDVILRQGLAHAIKIMSFQNLITYCREYLLSQSSSDEDEELKVQATELRAPFIKFEDTRCKYAPSVKELPEWPEINLDAPLMVGQTIFGFNHAHNQTNTPQPSPTPRNHANNHIMALIRERLGKESTQNCPPKPTAPISMPPTPNSSRRIYRRSPLYCELCGVRVAPEKIEDHLDSPEHKSNIESAKWNEVEGVIDSLPSLDSLITRKRVQLTNLDEHQEFLCLHKVESTISQMFLNSSK